MNKYGLQNFFIEELEFVPPEKSIDEQEIYWITKFNSVTPNGYNITKGGSKFKDDNPMFYKHICNKVSLKLKGDNNPAKRIEVREKIRKKAKNRKMNQKTKEKMSSHNICYWKGKHLPSDMIQKRSKTVIEKGCYKGANNPASKKVARLDINNENILEIYNCQTEAAEWIRNNCQKYKNKKVSSSNISAVCTKKQKTAFGFKWKFI